MTATIVASFQDGEDEVIILPPGFGFGIGVDVIIERNGHRIVVTPASLVQPPEKSRTD
jgi:hypothetical protein